MQKLLVVPIRVLQRLYAIENAYDQNETDKNYVIEQFLKFIDYPKHDDFSYMKAVRFNLKNMLGKQKDFFISEHHVLYALEKENI